MNFKPVKVDIKLSKRVHIIGIVKPGQRQLQRFTTRDVVKRDPELDLDLNNSADLADLLRSVLVVFFENRRAYVFRAFIAEVLIKQDPINRKSSNLFVSFYQVGRDPRVRKIHAADSLQRAVSQVMTDIFAYSLTGIKKSVKQ